MSHARDTFTFCLSAANNKNVAWDRLPVAGFSRSARHCKSKIFKFQANDSKHLEVILVVGWISEVLPLRYASCSFGVFLFSICTFLFFFGQPASKLLGRMLSRPVVFCIFMGLPCTHFFVFSKIHLRRPHLHGSMRECSFPQR